MTVPSSVASPAAFRRALAACSSDEFARFVVAVYREGGHDAAVTADGAVVRVDDRYLRVHHPGPFARLTGSVPVPNSDTGSDADTDSGATVSIDGIVTSRRYDRPDVTDATTLRKRVLYGLDADARAAVLDLLPLHPATATADGIGHRLRTLVASDGTPSRPDAPSRSRSLVSIPNLPVSIPAGQGLGEHRSSRRRLAAVAAVVGLVIMAGLLTVTSADSIALATVLGVAADGGGTAGSDVAPVAVPDNASTGPGSGTREIEYPPGVGPNGITDADRLAAAHAEAVSGRSYRLTLTYRQFHNGSASGFRRERVNVSGPDRYRSTVRQVGNTSRNSGFVWVRPSYANEKYRFVGRGADIYVTPIAANGSGVRGYYADRVSRYLRWFLTVEESRITDRFVHNDTQFFRLIIERDAWLTGYSTVATVLVDERGVVHQLRRGSARRTDGPRRVSAELTIHYDFGPVTVDRPVWVANATT